MACKNCHIQIKVLKEIPGHKAGVTVKVQVNGKIPVQKFWRDRLRDAAIDNCVEIVKARKFTTTKETEGDK